VLDPNKVSSIRTAYKSQLEAALAKVSSHEPSASMLGGQWWGMVWPADASAAERSPETGVEQDLLKNIGRASVTVPEGFVSFPRLLKAVVLTCRKEIHPKLQRHVKNRLASIGSGTGLDWATAEVLDFYYVYIICC
jgi:probable 2-oxoglutarate dehydrogenase E1 component DHKTD1